MDRIFGDVFGAPGRQGGGDRPGRRWSTFLPVNVTEDDTGYRLVAPVPGHGPDDIEVTFSDGVLTIRAEHQEPQEDQGQPLRREFFWGSSLRQLQLSGEIDAEKIEAHVENGLLTVRVPKAAAPQPKRIQISSGASGGKRLESGTSP
jgi:HSP20 family protein